MKKKMTTLGVLALMGMAGSTAGQVPEPVAESPARVPAASAPMAVLATEIALVATPQDTIEALYQRARRALNDRSYNEAARMFMAIHGNHPQHELAASSMYWDAFARYRTHSMEELEYARQLMDRFEQAYPNARELSEARSLAVRIHAELARRGDATAAERVARAAAPRADMPPRPPRPDRPQRQENDVRVAAINALMQMDSDRAIPILKQVLEMREEGSENLRRKAVFILSQQSSDETADILLDVAQNDPDTEVKEQAVFWLSQVDDPRAVVALDSILRRSTDRAVQEKAIFALSQHDSDRAGAALRDYVGRADAPDDLKQNAIFWLGQHEAPENQAFLRDLYGELDNQELKERVIFAVSQSDDPQNGQWLLDRAMDRSESVELRKRALFWAGQSDVLEVRRLDDLYSSMDDREMREQIVFVLSQRDEPEAVDVLMRIAENDPDDELRTKAIFWLGQVDDPRVAEFLLRLINRPNG